MTENLGNKTPRLPHTKKKTHPTRSFNCVQAGRRAQQQKSNETLHTTQDSSKPQPCFGLYLATGRPENATAASSEQRSSTRVASCNNIYIVLYNISRMVYD